MILLGAHQAVGAASERTMIESAALALLERLTIRQGRYLQKLDHFNGQIGNEDGVDEIIGALSGLAPAVLVQTGAAIYDTTSISRSRLKETLQLEILLISGHVRSRESRNIGDEAGALDAKADPGIYQMIADVRGILCSRELGVASVQRAVPVSEQVVIQAPAFTCWLSRFSVDYRFDQTLVPEAGPPVDSVLARHNLNDSAEVNPVAEGEATADG